MQVHLRELNELVERLAALGAPVDEQDQVVLLLHSLPTSFEGLVTAYLAKGEVRMAELRKALFSHEVRLDHDVSSGHPGASAFRAGHSGNSDGGCCEFHCRGCSESGDFRRDCQQRVQGMGRGSRGGWRRSQWNRGRTASNFAEHTGGNESYEEEEAAL